MELEKQVCSLELAKRLKELGVKQESLFYWRLTYHTSESFNAGIRVKREGIFGDYGLEYLPKPRYTTADVKWNEADLSKLYETEVSAFTVAELGEMLPEGITTYCTNIGGKWGWKSFYIITTAISVVEIFDTEADARAKMCIYLLENKLIEA